MIQQIEGLNSDLELALLVDVESAGEASVDLRNARSTELITMRVAEVRSHNAARRRRCTVSWLRWVCK